MLQESTELHDADAYRGAEGLRRLLTALSETFEELRFEPQEFLDLGDRVLVYVRLVGRGGLSGVAVDEELAHLWWERDGVAIRFEAFNDLERARATAGLA